MLRSLALFAARCTPAPLRRWVHRTPRLYKFARNTFSNALATGGDVVQIRKGPMRGLRLAVSSHISHAHVDGISEFDTLTALAKLIKPGQICYDLGASIGYMSLLMARTARWVYAFEPAPHAAAEIRRNAAANAFTNITIVPNPVSDVERAVDFALTDVAYGSSIARGDSKWPTLHMSTITLDAFVRDNPPPDLIKIDVEDEEGRVLLGARGLLQTRRPFICCELHSHESALTVIELLTTHGYRITTLTGEPFTIPPCIVAGQVQIIGLPPAS